MCHRKLDEIDLMVGDPQGRTRRVVRTLSFVVTGMSWMPDDSKLIINQQKGEFGQLYEISLSGTFAKGVRTCDDALSITL